MGYEIVYKYKDATDSPGVYSDEIKDKSVKIGKVTDDIGLEAVAAKVMAQLARRNILIVEVEIYEYAKKRVSYRETSTGIVIKNKKFSFDSGCVIETGDFEDEPPPEEFKPLPSPSKELADKSCPMSSRINIAPPIRRAIRHEIYEPEPLSLHKAQQKGLKLTVGKKYPIYSETSLGSTIIYKTADDKGKDIDVGSEYFVAMGSGLTQQENSPNYVGAENQKDEINLWRGHEQIDMPDIRSR